MHSTPARVLVTLVTSVTVATTAAPLRAAEPEASPRVPAEGALGPDEVTLSDGGFVRGTVVEVEPDDHVVIIPDGTQERRTIPWDRVERVERGKHAPAQPAEAPGVRRVDEPEPEPPGPEPAPEPASPPPVPERGKPRVHLELTRDKPVRLFIIGAEIQAGGPYGSMYGMKYQSVCSAPCDRVVDGSSGTDFFLGQDIWTASKKFRLDGYQGDVTIRVKPGSKALRIIGAVLVGLGIGGTIGGAIFVFGENTRKAGIGMLAAGGVGLAAGVPMLVLGRTRYEILPPGD